jgi:hypothetical protein
MDNQSLMKETIQKINFFKLYIPYIHYIYRIYSRISQGFLDNEELSGTLNLVYNFDCGTNLVCKIVLQIRFLEAN